MDSFKKMDEKFLIFLTEQVVQFVVHTTMLNQKLIDNVELLNQPDYFELKSRLNHAEKIWEMYLTRIKQDIIERKTKELEYINKDIADHYFFAIGIANTLIYEFETNKQ